MADVWTIGTQAGGSQEVKRRERKGEPESSKQQKKKESVVYTAYVDSSVSRILERDQGLGVDADADDDVRMKRKKDRVPECAV